MRSQNYSVGFNCGQADNRHIRLRTYGISSSRIIKCKIQLDCEIFYSLSENANYKPMIINYCDSGGIHIPTCCAQL